MREYAFPMIFNQMLSKNDTSQYQFAIDNDINPKTVNYWCNGRRYPTIKNLMYLSDLFEKPIDYLVYGEVPAGVGKEYVSLHVLVSLVSCMKKRARNEIEKEVYTEVINLICDIPNVKPAEWGK